jgi:hypothetical protein
MTSVSQLSLGEFNQLPGESAKRLLLGCCSSTTWAAAIAAARPYHSIPDMLAESDRAVSRLTTADLHAALAGHPRIGDRRLVPALQSAPAAPAAPAARAAPAKQPAPSDVPHPVSAGEPVGQGVAQPVGPAGSRPPPEPGLRPTADHTSWSSQEQAGVATAGEATVRALEGGNADYERRFGHIYLVCATGRSGAELLAFLRERLDNDRDTEWRVVSAELAKINRIRLGKAIGGDR